MWCPGTRSRRGPVVTSPPSASPRFIWLTQATGGGASPCQAQGRRFDPGHSRSRNYASTARQEGPRPSVDTSASPGRSATPRAPMRCACGPNPLLPHWNVAHCPEGTATPYVLQVRNLPVHHNPRIERRILDHCARNVPESPLRMICMRVPRPDQECVSALWLLPDGSRPEPVDEREG